MLKRFKVSTFEIESEILNTAHKMNCDDPDFEAFESILRAIIRVRALGKTAALVIGVSSKDNAQ